jgi:hypothetical protein
MGPFMPLCLFSGVQMDPLPLVIMGSIAFLIVFGFVVELYKKVYPQEKPKSAAEEVAELKERMRVLEASMHK